MLWDARVLAFDDFLVESLHVICSERRHQGTHFVENTAERPDITLRIIGLISPNFWTGIIRCTGLSVAESLFDDLGDIEIAQFGLHIFVQKDVGTFHIPMEDFPIMQGLETSDNLDENIPNLLFFDIGLSFLIVTYFLENVTIVCVLHYQAIAFK